MSPVPDIPTPLFPGSIFPLIRADERLGALPMFYVCEVGRPFGILAGPFRTETEATAAAGAIEIDQPKYVTRTEVWNYPAQEDASPVVSILPTASISPQTQTAS